MRLSSAVATERYEVEAAARLWRRLYRSWARCGIKRWTKNLSCRASLSKTSRRLCCTMRTVCMPPYRFDTRWCYATSACLCRRPVSFSARRRQATSMCFVLPASLVQINARLWTRMFGDRMGTFSRDDFCARTASALSRRALRCK